MINPFVYNEIATGSSFYDRKEDFNEIVKTLESGTNMVLYGPRHYGKTSLVFRVIDYFEQEKYICVYFNFMNVYSLENFIDLYSRALSRKQKPLKKFASFLKDGVQSIRPVVSINQETGEEELSIDFVKSHISVVTLDDILDLTEKLAGKNSRVFVFFDEFQEANKIPDVNFEGMLRSKIQLQNHEHINYLFFGSKTHMMQQAFMNNKRPFYQSARPMTLGLPPENETIEYLQRSFKEENMSISHDCASYLMRQATNIPYYVQMLASEVWQYMVPNEQTVTLKIINEAVKLVLNHNTDTYEDRIYNLSSPAKKLLVMMASDKDSGMPEEERKGIERELRDAGILEFKNMRYYIADPFLKHFIRNRY